MRSFRPDLGLVAAVSFAAFTGCGGGEPAAKTPVVQADAGAANAASTAPTAMRAPSPELQALAPSSTTSSVGFYADLGAMAKSSFTTELARHLLEIFGSEMDAPTKDCVARLLSSTRELAFGGDGTDAGGQVVTARLATGTAHDTLLACAAAAKDTHPTEPPATFDEAILGADGAVVARRGDVLVSGLPQALTALAAAKPQPWPTSLMLGPDAVLVVDGNDGDHTSGHGTLTMNASKLLATADVTFRDEAHAHAVREQAAQLVSPSLIPADGDPAASAALLRVFQALRIEQKGTTVSFAFDLEEDTAKQAADIAKVVSAGVYAIREYIVRSKKVEALSVLHELGKEYAAAFEAEPSTGHPRPTRLHSFPAVPKEVPHGVRYASGPADWAPWKDLGFEMSEPQFYQYEVKAAKDGKSADIIARGDLDGDGKTSELKLHITFDPKTRKLTVPIAPTEVDGNE